MLCFSYINLCTRVSYVTFNTDLNLYNKKKTLALPQYNWIFHLILLGLLLCECEREIILYIISPNIEFGIVLVFVIKFRRIISRTIFGCLLIYFFHSKYSGYLHSMFNSIPNMVLFLCEKCGELVGNYSHYLIQ